MKVAYIAHPVGGDVKGNLQKVIKIGRKINLTEPDVVPFSQFFFDCHTLNDGKPGQRERGIKNDTELLKRGFIDEVRLYGDKISPGMIDEILLAWKYEIPVIPMTKKTKDQYNILLSHMVRKETPMLVPDATLPLDKLPHPYTEDVA